MHGVFHSCSCCFELCARKYHSNVNTHSPKIIAGKVKSENTYGLLFLLYQYSLFVCHKMYKASQQNCIVAKLFNNTSIITSYYII